MNEISDLHVVLQRHPLPAFDSAGEEEEYDDEHNYKRELVLDFEHNPAKQYVVNNQHTHDFDSILDVGILHQETPETFTIESDVDSTTSNGEEEDSVDLGASDE